MDVSYQRSLVNRLIGVLLVMVKPSEMSMPIAYLPLAEVCTILCRINFLNDIHVLLGHLICQMFVNASLSCF